MPVGRRLGSLSRPSRCGQSRRPAVLNVIGIQRTTLSFFFNVDPLCATVDLVVEVATLPVVTCLRGSGR